MTYKNRLREIHMWWRKNWLSRPKLLRGTVGLQFSLTSFYDFSSLAFQ